MKFINIDMLKNPINWITIFLMLTIFGMFADIIARHYVALNGTVGSGQ